MQPDLALVLVIGAMGLNQLVMRVGALEARPWVFYPLQLINVTIGSVVLVFGLPGFDHLRFVSWLVGLLFLFHTVQNNNHRARFLRARADATRRARERQIRDALRASEDP